MNFNVSYKGAFAWLLVYVLMVFIYHIFRPSSVTKDGNKEIYKYSFADISVWFVALVLEILFFTKDILVLDVGGFILLMMVLFVFYQLIFRLKYRVIIQENKVSYGAFGKPNNFYLSDIADARVNSSSRREWLVVSLKYGGEVQFTSYLSGFKELCERMKSAAKRK